MDVGYIPIISHHTHTHSQILKCNFVTQYTYIDTHPPYIRIYILFMKLNESIHKTYPEKLTCVIGKSPEY